MGKFNIYLFESLGKYYIFDVNRNRILPIDDKTYMELKQKQLEDTYYSSSKIECLKDRKSVV